MKIIHIDMDCFYAAVEQRDRPGLRGKPIAVGGRPEGRGVIATASYEARVFGVRSAQASSLAMRMCPDLIIVRPDFSKYKNESRKVRDIFSRFTDKIEPLSLDEAYLDVTDAPAFDGSATRIAQEIRRLIHVETGLTASAGIAPNKFLAKVASEWNKPNGQKVIRPAEIGAFVRDLPVERIFGVGKVTAKRMHELGFKTCGDLQKPSVGELTNLFGSWGVKLYDYARGIDHREVSNDRTRKSLSVETTYTEDLKNLAACLAELPELYDEWLERMNRPGAEDRTDDRTAEKVRTAFVKVKFHDFTHTTHERAHEGLPPLSVFSSLLKEAVSRRSEPVRLLGIGVRMESKSNRAKSTPQLKFDV